MIKSVLFKDSGPDQVLSRYYFYQVRILDSWMAVRGKILQPQIGKNGSFYAVKTVQLPFVFLVKKQVKVSNLKKPCSQIGSRCVANPSDMRVTEKGSQILL
jgi:hypothetical protein